MKIMFTLVSVRIAKKMIINTTLHLIERSVKLPIFAVQN